MCRNLQSGPTILAGTVAAEFPTLSEVIGLKTKKNSRRYESSPLLILLVFLS